jgi:hypothetical protein
MWLVGVFHLVESCCLFSFLFLQLPHQPFLCLWRELFFPFDYHWLQAFLGPRVRAFGCEMPLFGRQIAAAFTVRTWAAVRTAAANDIPLHGFKFANAINKNYLA